MPPKRGRAKAASKEPSPPPKRGSKASPPEPAAKRGAKAPAAEPPAPKRAVKADPPEPPPKSGAKAASSATAAEPPPEAAEDYDGWPVPRLQARLKELGVPATGSKAALLERVKACAAVAPAAKPPPAPKAESSSKRKPSPVAPDDALPKKEAKTAAPKASASSSPPDFKPAESVTYEDGEFKADYAKSNRSTCKRCLQTIDQGSMRLGKMVASDKFDGKVPQWQHASCFLSGSTLPRSTALISGFSTLRPEDQELITKRVPPPGGAENGDSGQNDALREQNAEVFEVLDILSSMSPLALREMLDLNGYPTQKTGVTTTLPELCADGIVFGATGHCEVCDDAKWPLLLSGEGYRCTGWVNEYLKCSFKTQAPQRTPWKLTETAKSTFGDKLKKKRRKTGDRLFANDLSVQGAETGQVTSAPAPQRPLSYLQIAVANAGANMTKEQLVKFIQEHGGTFEEVITRATTCVISTQDTADEAPAEVKAAKQHEVPGVEDGYLTDSVEKGELQDMTPYLLWGEARRARRVIKEAVTSRFVEKDGVSMDADVGELGDKAHVLVELSTKTVYSEMMNRTDLVSGANSFYTLHLLESDDTDNPQYWVFRKWGRIGVTQGGTKVEDFGSNKAKAVHNFEKQYEEKTGNAFGHARDDFVVKPGKFTRIDMQHKALGPPGKKAKTEAGDGGGDQPLGQLSKVQIEKGDKVLDKIDTALSEGLDPKSPAGSAKYLGFSAEFYSLIPHNFGMSRPPTILNADMVGAERALLQFYLRMGFEDMGEVDASLTPISGVMDLALPKTLQEAASKVCGAKDITACHTKALGLVKKKAGKPKEAMNPALYGAILLYTANAIYKDLNKSLRDENRAKVQKYFAYLRLLFEACGRLPQTSRTLWRGIGVDLSESYKVGNTIIWWGVSSCTSEKKVAQDFMKGCGDKATFLTVETQTACDISELSFYSNEAESILLPGTQLEVIKSEKMGKNAAITLREVGRVVK